MYKFFFETTVFPVTPGKLEMKIKNQNKTINLINESEVNLLKAPGLTSIEFSALIPSQKYPWSFQPLSLKTYLDFFERLKTSKKPFQFSVVRSGNGAFGTSMSVTIEDYEISESQDNFRDLLIKFRLKQFKAFGVKTVTLPAPKPVPAPVAPPKATRPADPPKPRTYTVKRGDCLWNIAIKYYGSGAKYPKIFNANRHLIKNPSLIYPGWTLTIPD